MHIQYNKDFNSQYIGEVLQFSPPCPSLPPCTCCLMVSKLVKRRRYRLLMKESTSSFDDDEHKSFSHRDSILGKMTGTL